MQLSFFTLFALVSVAVAIPTGPSPNLQNRASSPATSSVSQDTITNTLTRPALHARLAYCPSAGVAALSCGDSCSALNGIKILATGGDGDNVPKFYVAADPSIQAVVVAHQGTDPTQLLSVLNDVEIKHVKMDSTRFPKAASGAEVHDGFHDTQLHTADTVLSTVKSALSSSGFKTVLTTGHSLGAAIALLDATMLSMVLPSDIKVQAITFGMPRVGNEAFANMIDGLLPDVQRVTNQHDIVTVVPPQILGFEQVSGEFHITSVDKSGAATMLSCPGHENINCADGNSILKTSIANHLGPYFDGISFGAKACS